MNISAQLPDMTIEAVLERWPETAVVFQRYHLACVGCVMAPFCKVQDAINTYNLHAELFINDLLKAISHDTTIRSDEPVHS